MAYGMASFSGILLSLLLVSSSGSIVQQIRHANSRQQSFVASSRQLSPADQEALTREDILQQENSPPAQSMPNAATSALPAGAPQQPAPAMAVPTYQAQQLLQAQAKQMAEMQRQMQKQQLELERLQQAARQAEQRPAPQPKKQRAPEQTPKKSLVGVGSKVQTNAGAQSGMSGHATPKGWDQCLKFARFVKTQDVTGVELVRVWKSTCEPAVQSGRATQRYKLMCNSLSGVVEPYAAQIDYDVEMLCDAVLAVFHDVTATDVRAR